ncbi:hypothetical protein ABFX02_13G075200 [Erythranthe guttata]
MAMTEQRSGRRLKSSHREQIEDRISDLPDSVLSHILSFLSTQESVATAILGRRWRYLWSYVPNLDFDCVNQEIIYRVLLQHKLHSLTAFRLRYATRCSAYQLETWITFAVARNVRKLDLRLKDHVSSRRIALPRCLFTCETLVHLTLDSCGVVPSSGAVRLPRLEKLHLWYLDYETDESLPRLISGCPVLEELSIIFYWDIVYCNVSSPTIKRFLLKFTSEYSGGPDRLEINTPALEYIEINDYFLNIKIKCGVLTSLFEANITLQNDGQLCFQSVRKCLDSLCNVKYLTLDLSRCVEIIDSVPSPWTTSFRNLTKLELTADCCFLPKFLEIADNLEILIFTEQCCYDQRYDEEEIEEWKETPQRKVPTCLSSHVRIIKLLDIKGNKHDFEFIRYLLRNAQVLEMMEIAYAESLTLEEKVNILEKISRFQRGSNKCEVAFVDVKVT